MDSIKNVVDLYVRTQERLQTEKVNEMIFQSIGPVPKDELDYALFANDLMCSGIME